ncbi:winged helix-turn-helix domain-containing protein [Acetobacteraceae bacterium H6797]|nr:winged helix-turn-helix domain-containing protein [Acetobacteraceae bacterium H6797]
MDSFDEIRFGPFTLLPASKRLLRGAEPLRIGQRAMDLLIALATRPGEVLDRDALMQAVWPGRHVEESNLRAQVAALRKVLGESEDNAGHVLTIPGRGYSFISHGEAEKPPEAPASSLPLRLHPILGREEAVRLVTTKLEERRFVSIIGAGGIGKTTLALAVAQHSMAAYAQPPLFVDLGTLTDPALVKGRLLSLLEAEGKAGGLANALAGAHRLIILDSCEPVIAAAAELAELVLQHAPGVHVLATSREPLRAEGEWTYRLPSMEVPASDTGLTMREALSFSAIALFADRMQAAGAEMVHSDEEAALIARICRQLDGIPLAIELAATRASQLGLRALSERLDDRFRLLMQGRRTALPRHQTLAAALDWSYGLLAPEEQRLLRRLAVFHGCFTLAAALAVGGEGDEAEIVDRIGRLVDKSLLGLQARPDGMVYRCLDTTRLYLAGKLAEAGETEAACLRHATFYDALFQEAEGRWMSQPVPEVRARLAPDIDNLRAAIDWCLAPERPSTIGIRLTLSGVPLWAALGLMEEARRRLDVAIAAFRANPAHDAELGMRLYCALGSVTVFLAGTVESAWVNTLILAERLGNTEFQLNALNGLTVAAMRRDYREALAYAQRFRALAWSAGEPDDGPVGDRLEGYVQHILGNQSEAMRLTQAMLARYPQRSLQPHQNRLNFYDQRSLSKSTLARILWLRGETVRALALVDEAVAEAKALDHPSSYFFALAVTAGPVAFLARDLQRAAKARASILEELGQMAPWMLWGESLLALERIAAGEVEAGVAMLRDRMASMAPTSFNIRLPILHAGLTEALLGLGRPEEALVAVDKALVLARETYEGWFEPEYLRLRGECLIARGWEGDAAEAEALFRKAFALAEEQTALAWSLRTATSLARLRPGEAEATLLASIVERFPEGEETPDLVAARAALRVAA